MNTLQNLKCRRLTCLSGLQGEGGYRMVAYSVYKNPVSCKKNVLYEKMNKIKEHPVGGCQH